MPDHRLPDTRERSDKTYGDKKRIDPHRHIEPPRKPLADQREADHGKRTLSEPASQGNRDPEIRRSMRAAHEQDRHAEGKCHQSEHNAAPEPVNQPAHWKACDRTDERCPKIDGGV